MILDKFGLDILAIVFLNPTAMSYGKIFFMSYLPILQLLPTFASSSVMFPLFLLARLKLY